MNKKGVIYGIIIAAIVVLGLVWAGLFPLMVVDGDFRNIVWYREFSRTVRALEKFETASRGVSGAGELSSNDVKELRRSTLENIIADRVAKRYIKANFTYDDLQKRAADSMDKAIQSADQNLLPKAVEQLYGMTLEEYKEVVLMPQALKDELAKDVTAKQQNFEEVFLGELRNTKVRILFVPFRWQDGRVVDK